MRYAEEATRLADQTTHKGLQLAMHAYLAYAWYFADEPTKAIAVCDAARAQFPPDPSLGVEFSGYSSYLGLGHARTLSLTAIGRLQEAVQEAERTEQLARRHDEVEILAWVQSARIEAHVSLGDTASVLERARLVLELAEKTATATGRVAARRGVAGAYILLARWSEALAALEEMLRLSRESRLVRVQEGFTLAWIAKAFLGQGD